MKYNYQTTKAVLFFLFLFSGFYAARAGYQPVAVTGYNADVVANGAGSATTSTNADVDGAGYAFMAPTYNPSGTTFPTSFLPATGVVNSAATPGLSFQLASYSSNNCLRIPATGAAAAGTGTVTLVTPVSAGEVFITGTGGSGAVTVDITVTFTDNTTQVFAANTSFKDWFGGTPFTMQGLGRVVISSNTIENSTTDPRLYEAKLVISAANYGKQIASIGFSKTASGVLNVMGVSINPICAGGTVTVQAPTTACSGVAFTMTANGAGLGVGSTYQWQSAPGSTGPWTNIASATGSSYNNPGQTATTSYRIYTSCNGGTADTSAVVTIGMTPQNQCYCIPTATSSSYYINSFSTTGGTTNITNSGTGAGITSAGYSNYTAQTMSAVQGTTVNFSSAFTGGTFGTKIFVDWNQDGDFTDANETMYSSTGYASSASGSFIVPVTPVTGNTRMRIRVDFNNSSGPGPCAALASGNGEAEDYTFTVIAAPGCIAPTAQPTALVLGGGVTSVMGSFTAAVPAPTKYMIVRTSGAALNTTPVNGTFYAAGGALGNGTVVYTGPATSFTDNGLVQNTSYTYTVFALNDACTGEPFYNTASPLTGTVMTRVPMAFTWNATSGTNDWTVASNWTPARTVPDLTDTLYFTNGGTPTANNIPTQSVSKISIANSTRPTWNTAAGNTITISTNFNIGGTGDTLNLAGANNITLAFTGTPVATIAGTLNLSGSGTTCTYAAANSVTTVSGTVIVSGATASLTGSATSLIFTGTGAYVHARNAGTIPTATYNAGSNVNVTGIVGGSPTPPATIGGNLTWNCPNQTIAPATLSSTLTSIGGTFNLVNTGTGTFQFGTSPTIAIAGLTTVSNGTLLGAGGTLNLNGGLTITGGTIRGTAATTINVTGNTSQTGGSITSSTTGSTLTMNLKGDFMQSAAGTVSQTSTGSMSFVFNGTAAQTLTLNGTNTGILNYRVNNTGGLNLAANLNINNGATLTLSNAGTNIPAGTVVFGATNTTLVYNSTTGSQTSNATEWPAVNGPTNVTINNTLGTVTVPSNRTISGTLTMTAGDINLGANTLTLGTSATATGTLTYTAGNIRLTSGSFIRWFGTSGLPTATGTGVGFYPVAYGPYNRNVALYFNNATALSAGGSIGVSHTNAGGLQTGLSVADGAYTINNRTNASWSFAANGVTLGAGNSLGMRLTGTALFVTSTPANLRVMQPAAVVGTHVAGSGVSAQRSGMSVADLASVYHIGAAAADMNGVYVAINTGNWSAGSTWDIGTPPAVGNDAYINPGVNVTVDAPTNTARSLTVSSGGTLTANANTLTIDSALTNNGTVIVGGGTVVVNGGIGMNGITNNTGATFTLSSGTVTLGPTGGSKKPFTNSGTLTISGGTLNINGNLNCIAGSVVNQSGGTINVDGNAAGVAANSVACATPIVSLKSSSLTFTGGVFTIVDAHACTTGTNTLEYNNSTSVNAGGTHVFSIGNGVSTDPGGQTPYNFSLNTNVGSGKFAFNNLVVNAGTAANSAATIGASNTGVLGNVTVNSGGELRVNGANVLYVNGNFTVNTGGTYTASTSTSSPAGALYFGSYANGTVAPATAGAQVLSGGGTFRNMVTGATAKLAKVTVSNSAGVTFNIPNPTFSNTFTFVAGASGPTKAIIPAGNALIEIAGGSASGASQTAGWVYGRYQKAAATGGMGHTFPVGDTGTYAPVVLNGAAGTVTVAGDIWASTTKLDHTNINTSEINATKSVNRFYTVQPVNGLVIAPGTVTAIFNWAASDVDAGATPTKFKGGYYNATSWTYPTTGTAAATSLQLTGLGASLGGDYQIGERCAQLVIATQPTDQVGCLGVPVTFSVGLSDTSGALYQWQKGTTPIPGANAPSYTISSPVAGDAGSYSVVITSACPTVGSVTSAAANLTMNTPPAITGQPTATQTICEGSPVTFSVTATGSSLTYQWQKGTTPIPGANGPSYNINTVAPGDAGSYSVVVSGVASCASATSNNAALIVNPLPLTITAASTTTFCAGGSVQLNASTLGGLTYQWYKNNVAISSATSSSYSATTTGSYTAIITNTANGCTDTSNAISVVNAAPVASVTPAAPAAICQGDSIVLKAANPGGLTFQWSLNTNPVTNATADSFVVYNSGSYTVTVSTGGGGCSTTSSAVNVTVNPLPTATASAAGATTVCQGSSVTLNANTGTGLTYQWLNNGTNISGATSASYNATATGSYTVKVTNSNGCSKVSAPVSVTVNPVPTATATAGSATTFCQGGSVTLNANTGTGLTYQWQLGGNPIGSATNSSYTANASGAYTVKVTNGFNCSTTSNTVNVTVNPLPTAIASPAGPLAICAGSSATLSANTGTGLTYQWKNGGTNISGATSATYNATAAGSYTVLVTNSSTTCQQTSNAVTVTVNPLPATPAITPPGPAAICAGQSVVLNSSTGAGLSYQWTQNNNNINGATSTSYTANATGAYRIKVTDGNNCSSTSTPFNLTVNPLPSGVITYNNPLSFCEGAAVVLTVDPATGLSYQWNKDGAPIPGGTGSAHAASQTGVYTVTLTNGFNCSAPTSNAVNVTVFPKPNPVITQNNFLLSTGTFSTYQWYFNNQLIPGATSQSYLATQNGAYKVKVTDANGCDNTSEQYFINTVSVSNPGITKGSIKLYPNPASAVLHIEAPITVNAYVRNMEGKTVLTQKDARDMDISSLPNGLYMIMITDAKGNMLLLEKVTKVGL